MEIASVPRIYKGIFFSLIAFAMSQAPIAFGLPAFARREGFSCTMCHMNGSAPHLTEYGYMYRRSAFRPPNEIGDMAADQKAFKINDHLAAGLNVNYEYTTNKPTGGTTSVTANNINMPEVEIFPLVGGFFGHYGFWSEFDGAPATNTDGGGVDLGMADARYVAGTANEFINIRAGLIAPEGYGASDQWLDDGNIPLMDQLAPQYGSTDMMATPFGAMESPEMGFELGLNYNSSHLTLGAYNGFTDIDNTGNAPAQQPDGVVAATVQDNSQGMRDYKVQLDQFLGQYGAFTAAYYHGIVGLWNSNAAGTNKEWLNHYNEARLYLTAFAVPNVVDILAGYGTANSQYVTGGALTSSGTFNSNGDFIGANWYVRTGLTLSARMDNYKFNTKAGAGQKANGYSLQASIPYNNRIIVLHYNYTKSDYQSGEIAQGTTNDFGATLRFLF